ncbi:hypothetical protein L209DRAFT_748445 [Thermothelomyces heterothallicus CBS 203.75]
MHTSTSIQCFGFPAQMAFSSGVVYQSIYASRKNKSPSLHPRQVDSTVNSDLLGN